MAKYPKEEKEQLIEEFKNSGLSIASWTWKNGLPISTVTRWVSKHYKKSKHSKDVKFIEIKTTQAGKTLKIEIGAVNILVDRYTDLELLAKVIKVVNEINV
ncbi:hypothetical protein EHV10_12045 [Lachnoanaerobaculum gingivalis]|uniref:Transposase n=1 Tax=Lachnoanaerobaculum gingivalis TaxID=2490855 RepID=A0A3P3QTE2_9FIRM|nr:hypothetical protein [Lachnoanaerobaculum gingivalis]RRJ24514.1 hypothetical protein EHV10_12045 [Lachnoanaerobaculum gingivalis]